MSFTLKLTVRDGVSFSCRSTDMAYAGSYSGNSNGSAVTVPYNIPDISSAYVSITSHILYACDIWEKADALAGKNTGKFLPSVFSVTCVVVVCMYLLQS